MLTDTITILPKLKWRTRKITKRGSPSGGGHSGSRYRKKHMLAYGQPGTSNGRCVKQDSWFVTHKIACACGGCGA